MEVISHLHAPTALPPGKAFQPQLQMKVLGFRAGLDAVVKRKLLPPLAIKLLFSSCRGYSPVTIQTELLSSQL
jgi:hypothetical protein